MIKRNFLIICASLLFVFSFAQEKLNSIGISGAMGLSGRTHHSSRNLEDFNPDDGLFTSFGLEYGRKFNKFEMVFSLGQSHHSDVLRVEIDTFKLIDSSYYVGYEATNALHHYYLTLTPALKYNFIESNGFSLYAQASIGINHFYKDKMTIKNDFKAIYQGSDTTIYNSTLNDMRKLALSAGFTLGIAQNLSKRFSISSELFYVSFLHNIFKEPIPNAWTRLYNYGGRVNLKVRF